MVQAAVADWWWWCVCGEWVVCVRACVVCVCVCVEAVVSSEASVVRPAGQAAVELARVCVCARGREF